MDHENMAAFPAGVTLLGGSPLCSGLQEALALAPNLVCADGGANNLQDDLIPDAIIGDLDSLDERESWQQRLGARLIHVAEQDSTDLEKCLLRLKAPFILGVGFLGGRIDHELAALHALVEDPRPILLIGEEDVILSAGEGISLETEPGDRLSIFPMRAVTAGPDRGLQWPVEGLHFEAGVKVGTSNETTGPVELSFDRPGAVVILPRERLDLALAGLMRRAETPGRN